MERQDGIHWQQMPADQFAALGTGSIAYIRPKTVDGRTVYAIHTADGNEVAVVAGRALAFATVKQNDLEPVSVH